jgi:hypothetical protein
LLKSLNAYDAVSAWHLSDFTSEEQEELLNEKLDQCSLEEVYEVWLASDEYARRVAAKQAEHARQKPLAHVSRRHES